MKLDFNCTICINKSGKSFFFFFHFSSVRIRFPIHKWEWNICILNLFHWRGDGENQNFLKLSRLPWISKFLHLLYPSLDKLRKVSEESLGEKKNKQQKSILRKIPIYLFSSLPLELRWGRKSRKRAQKRWEK